MHPVSVEAIAWAFEQEGMSVTQKVVLVALGDHFNKQLHYAFPSHATLARRCSAARSTVQTALLDLENKLGLIVSESRVDKNGRQTSSRYYLPDFDPLSHPGAIELSGVGTARLPGTPLPRAG